jgi:Arc/MetJ-type ribon-helix-helix transcriptional regulator
MYQVDLMTEEKQTVSISTPLYDKVKEKIKGTEFTSVSGYVEYVLRELLSEEGETEEFSKEDEEKIKSRLRSLGYLD